MQHVVSRSVRDSAAALDATRGPAPGDMAVAPPPARPYLDEVGADPGRLRIGFLDRAPGSELHADCVAAVRAAASLLDELGHDVDDSHPDVLDDVDDNRRQFAVRWCTNARMALIEHGNLVGRELTADDVESTTWAMAEMGKLLSAVDLAGAIGMSARFTRRMAQWWTDGHDVLLTPTLGQPPPPLGELAATPDDPWGAMARSAPVVPFTTHFNVTGQPAISLPLHWNDAGLPIGVHLVAAFGREDVLFRVAGQLEAARPWADRRPALAA